MSREGISTIDSWATHKCLPYIRNRPMYLAVSFLVGKTKRKTRPVLFI